MRLTPEQLEAYETQGYVLLPSAVSRAEVEALKAAIPALFAEDTPRRVVEAGTGCVRSVYGSHVTHDLCARLVRHPALVEPAMQIAGSPVYVYQFKINAKTAFGGDVWPWHQDYIFWRNEDGLPAPRITNVTLFLDEVTEFNGPMFLVPGSHRGGVIEPGGAAPDAGPDTPGWMNNLTANLKYSLSTETVAALCARHGLVSPKGPAGSVLLFHPNIVHGSPQNISPFARALAIVTYNSVHNLPAPTGPRRPEFLVSRSYDPVVPDLAPASV